MTPKKIFVTYSVAMPVRNDAFDAIFEDPSVFPPFTINFNGTPLSYSFTKPTFIPQTGQGIPPLFQNPGRIEQTFDTGLFITKPGDTFSGKMYFNVNTFGDATLKNLGPTEMDGSKKKGYWYWSDMVFSIFNFGPFMLGSDLTTTQKDYSFTAVINEDFFNSSINSSDSAYLKVDLRPIFSPSPGELPQPEITGGGAPAPPPPPPPTLLDVSVFYNPSPPFNVKFPDILVNGISKGSKNFIIPVSPGNNVVSFGDFDYDKIIYKTPDTITVNFPASTTVKAQ